MVDGGRLSFFTQQLSAVLEEHNQSVKFCLRKAAREEFQWQEREGNLLPELQQNCSAMGLCEE